MRYSLRFQGMPDPSCRRGSSTLLLFLHKKPGSSRGTVSTRTVYVVVELSPHASEDEDGVEGVWEVDLHEEAKPPIAAGRALDTFHNKVCIEELDSYEIHTLDANTLKPIFEPDNYDRGGDRGTVEWIAESLTALRRARKQAPSR